MSDFLDSALAALRAQLAQFGQHARILRLHTPLGADVLLPEGLSGRESLSEGGFRFELSALSTDANIELKRLIGQPVLIELLTQQSRDKPRPFHGHVTEFELVGAEGGFARYRLVIKPWLAFLGYRQDSYVFQDKSVVEILEEVFTDYRGQGTQLGHLDPAWRFELADANLYPKRSLCIQYEESDLAFVERLLAEEGLFYWFEHEGAKQEGAPDAPTPHSSPAGEGGERRAQAAPAENRTGRHVLVIADHNAACKSNAQGQIAYRRTDATEAEDTIQRWHIRRELATNRIELASWDYRSVAKRPVSADAAGPIDLAAHDTPGAYAYTDSEEGSRYAERQLEALQARTYLFHGQGTVRTLAPGSTFLLTGQAEQDRIRREQGEEAARVLVTSVEHRARNNLTSELRLGVDKLLGSGVDTLIAPTPSPSSAGGGGELRARAAPAASRIGEGEQSLYTNDFQAIPATTPWRSISEDGHGQRIHPKPTVAGMQTAIVVGVQGEPVSTERDHRIKVQFHWQRGAKSHSRQPHPAGSDNAPANEKAGTWVRVATPLAGADWGAVFVPRLGQEVLIAFLGGDIDRPVVIGALYNGRGQDNGQTNTVAAGAGAATGNAPAWFAGSQGAHAHNAVLSGIKTQALASSKSGAGGYNQLVFDDTPNEARLTLATTEDMSALTLGHLKHQQDNERKASRGHGAELITLGYGAVRAGSGLLLTSHARPNAGSTQLDAREAQSQLTQSEQLTRTLADTAQKHKASLAGEPAPDKLLALEQLKHSLEVLQATDSGTGQSTPSPSPEGEGGGGGENQSPGSAAIGGGEGKVPAWSEPLLLTASPTAIAALTPADTVISAGNTLSLTAGQDIDFMAQADNVWAVKDGIVLFTYGKAADGNKPNRETGMKLHAASGQVSVQAHSDLIEASAEKSVTVASTTKAVQLAAPQHVLLTAQGAYVRLQGGNIEIHAPKDVSFKASQKNLTGPASASASLELPKPSALKGCAKRMEDAAAAGGAV